MNVLNLVQKNYLKADPAPEFRPGDTLRVHVKIKEGARERIQVFEGVVIARQHGGLDETFTVRKISSGVGVERVFPLHCPSIDKIEVQRKGRETVLPAQAERKGRAHQGAPRLRVEFEPLSPLKPVKSRA